MGSRKRANHDQKEKEALANFAKHNIRPGDPCPICKRGVMGSFFDESKGKYVFTHRDTMTLPDGFKYKKTFYCEYK